MSHHEASSKPATAPETPQMPGPDPALRRLDPFVGTWEMRGRTLDSTVDNVRARATFEWLPGGHFLVQRFSADFMGMTLESTEVIGYDPATGTFPSTVYSNLVGMPLPYRWEVDGNELKITAEAMGATFRGRLGPGGHGVLGRLATRSGPRERPWKRPL